MRINLQAGQSFCAYRIPGEATHQLCLGELETSIDYDHPGILIAGWDKKESRKYLRAHRIYSGTDWDFTPYGNLHRTVMDHSEYIKLARRAIRGCYRDFKKVILSRIIQMPHEQIPIYELFTRLCDCYPEALVFAYHSPEDGLWMGASPEVVLAWDKDEARIDSLAGTRRVVESEWDKKNEREQALVTEYICGLLRNYGIAYRLEERGSLEIGPLRHIHSSVHFSAGPLMDHLLRQLHPTPALAGLPRSRAVQWIEKQEPHARRLYAGYLGIVDSRQGHQMYATIRCMEVDTHHAYLYVGGGITAMSDPELEWQETKDKSTLLTQPMAEINQRYAL